MAGKPAEKPAEKPAGKPAEKPAKKAAGKKGASGLKHTFYKIEDGRLERLRTSCPKCGAGVFLAKHSDRVSCGRCGYAEFAKA